MHASMHKGQGVMHQLTCQKIFVKGISIVKTIPFVYGILTVKKNSKIWRSTHIHGYSTFERPEKHRNITGKIKGRTYFAEVRRHLG